MDKRNSTSHLDRWLTPNRRERLTQDEQIALPGAIRVVDLSVGKLYEQVMRAAEQQHQHEAVATAAAAAVQHEVQQAPQFAAYHPEAHAQQVDFQPQPVAFEYTSPQTATQPEFTPANEGTLDLTREDTYQVPGYIQTEAEERAAAARQMLNTIHGGASPAVQEEMN